MNAKHFFLMAIILLFSGVAFSQLTDYTPQQVPTTNSNQPVLYDSSCVQTSAMVSQLSAKVDAINADMIKMSDFAKIKDDFFKSFSDMFNTIIVQQVTVLFVFTILFFCLLFIAKARRLI